MQEIDFLARAVLSAVDLRLRERLEENLSEFQSYVWPIIDPGSPMVGGWPMDAIAAHLEAVTNGNIRRLLITVPPGFSKSTMSSVVWPLWTWLKKPHYRFICASYSEKLTQRDNQKCRHIIAHENFQRLWSSRIRLIPPTRFDRFDNDKTGWKMATSVGGTLLGHRGDVIILDDPNSPDVESDAVRRSVNLWFREVVPTRLNDMANSAIIVIQQRMHMEDVAGCALASHEDWVHLNIPMEYEPREYANGYRAESDQVETFVDDLSEMEEEFWSDPRTIEGELAWPERFPRKVVADLREVLGPTAASAQLQQSPIPRGGAIIKREYWQTWRELKFPPLEFIVASLDTAYTEKKKNDPSAMTIWGITHDVQGIPRVLLLYAWEAWLNFHELVEKIVSTCTVSADPDQAGHRFAVDRLLIEGKASGLSVQQELDRVLRTEASFGIDMIDPDRDKIARVYAIEHLFTQKMIWAPDRAYADKVIDQMANFPYSDRDDLVDSTTQCLSWLRACGFTPTATERVQEEAALLTFRPKMRALYPV